MGSLIKLSVVCSLILPLFIIADENIEVEQKNALTLNGMFEEDKISGNIRTMYAGYDYKTSTHSDTYATAIGGSLKYELAELNGFNAAAAFTMSHDVDFATGEGVRQNSELSSSDGKYTALSEAYLNYKYDNFNFRAGRQVIDTPLADSDDIRMIPNTFEAYIATYEFSNFSFMAGKLQKWQGYDAGLDEGWVKAGEDGTWFGSMIYSAEMIEAGVSYYNITKLINAAYFDIAFNYEINSEMSILASAQYLNESEISNSGTEATIYGVMAELSAYGITLRTAYNKSNRKAGKESFSGFGGGALFTSMDTMILNEITYDRDAEALVGSIAYEIDKLTLTYSYGDFDGDADGAGNRAHIAEQDFRAEYSVIKDKLAVCAIYAIQKDKESLIKTDNDWSRFQLMVAYNF